MSVDYSAQLDFLREIQRKVQAKEDVPESDFLKAGLKKNARLKDIEKEISATKKKVSHETKKEAAEEEEKELELEAKANSMTLEQYKEYLDEDKINKAFGDNFAERQKAQERSIAAARAKKSYENKLADEGYLQ